jgi:hypothetical protein
MCKNFSEKICREEITLEVMRRCQDNFEINLI